MDYPNVDSVIKGKWNQFKGEIQKTWGKITHDDLDQVKGGVRSLTGLIQEKYGHAKEEVTRKLDEIVVQFSSAHHLGDDMNTQNQQPQNPSTDKLADKFTENSSVKKDAIKLQDGSMNDAQKSKNSDLYGANKSLDLGEKNADKNSEKKTDEFVANPKKDEDSEENQDPKITNQPRH